MALMFFKSQRSRVISKIAKARANAKASAKAKAQAIRVASVKAEHVCETPGECTFVPQEHSEIPLAKSELRCLAQAIVASLVSSASQKAAALLDDSSSDSTEGLFQDVLFEGTSDAELDELHAMVDCDRSGSKVLDQIQGKLMKATSAAHRNMERVADVVSQVARAQSERFQEKTDKVKDVTHAFSVTVSGKAHTGLDFAKEKADIARGTARSVSVTVSQRAHNKLDFAKEQVENARNAAIAVSATMSEKAHHTLDFAKEKAESARGTAIAVSATMSEKAHSSFDLARERAEVARGTAHAVSTSVTVKAQKGFDLAKDAARSVRDGNCLESVQVMPTHIIRRRGGA